MVGRVRALLEKDAKARGVQDNRKKRRRPWMKVGHGGTLDPLASGVLVVGVGKGALQRVTAIVLESQKSLCMDAVFLSLIVCVLLMPTGTKNLQKYLTGSKGYTAGVELGYQTTTLDLDKNADIVGKMPFDHVTWENVESTLDSFRGTIQQKPPIFRCVAD